MWFFFSIYAYFVVEPLFCRILFEHAFFLWVFPYEGCIGTSCTCFGTPNMGETQLRKENPHPSDVWVGARKTHVCFLHCSAAAIDALHSRLRDPGDGCDARW